MKVLVADTETNSLLIDATKFWCLGVKDLSTGVSTIYSDSSPKYPSLREGHQHLLTADRIVFHNGLLFDRPVMAKFGFKLDWRKIWDTVVVSRVLNHRRPGGHSLSNWGYFLGNHKGEFNDFSQFSEEMVDYLRQDLEVGAGAYLHLINKEKAEDYQRALDLEFEVTHRISQQIFNGFSFDKRGAISLNAELIAEKEKVILALQDIFPPILVPNGEPKTAKVNYAKRWIDKGSTYQNLKWEIFNPGSRQQIAKRLTRKYGWKPKHFTPKGQVEINETILQELPYPECGPLLEYLAADKKCGMNAGWIDAERNGKIHGSVNPQGAVTGRMTHSEPNVANADKDKRMRRLWRCRQGWKLIGVDADALELRMMAHFLHPYDRGAFARQVDQGKKEEGTDPHTINQHLVGLYLRDSAKTFIYAKIYGSGAPNLGSIIIADADTAGKPRPKGPLGRLGAIGSKALDDGIVGLGDLKKKIEFRITKQGYFLGLDKRKIFTDAKHVALNYLFQGAGAIVMKEGLIVFCNEAEKIFGPHGQHWALCANVHDEFQIEADPSIAEEIGRVAGEALTTAGLNLNIRCPIRAGKPAIGNNWSETH
jgi:DNA polymerase I